MSADPRNAATFARRYGPWALIAGASEGIGQAYARELAARGLHLVLVARRPGPLEETAADIRALHGVQVRVAAADLGAPDVLAQLAPHTDDVEIGLLVYNAAYAHIGEYVDQSLESKLATIDVNCRGPVLLTSYFGEKMVGRGRGGILLMSSMAGFQGSCMVTAYAATKAFDTVLGEGLWAELGPKGVDVLVCVAGATLTPNFEGQTPAEKRKMAFPMTAEAVAREGIAHLGKGPTHITGAINRGVHATVGRLPRKLAVSFMASNTKKLYG